MGSRLWRTAPLALMMLVLAGCPERSDRFENAIGLVGPHVVQGRAVYLSYGRQAALILDPVTGEFTVARLSAAPQEGVPVPGRDQLAVLLSEAEVLEVVDVITGEVSTFELGSRFDALALSDDGGFAIASFAGGVTGVLSNAAEVAVIDLQSPSSATNPTRRTVASAGGAPIGIDVSPPFGPAARRIAIIRSVDHLAAIDLTQPAGATRSIPLVPSNQTTVVTPLQIEFAVRGQSLDVFVRVAGLNDVYHLTFDGNSAVDGAPLPLLNQFATGAGPSDMAVWDDDGTLSLLVVNAGSRDLTVVDVDSAVAVTVPLNTAANRILLYDGASGREALCFAAGGSSKQFHRVALEDLAVKKSKAVTTRSLVSPILGIDAVAGGDWFLVTHAGGSGAVTLVEGSGNRIMPFTGGGQVTGSAVSADGSEIYVLTRAAAGPQLSIIDVASGHPETMDLDSSTNPTGIHRLADDDFLLITHDDEFGSLTLVRSSEIEDGKQKTITGFGLWKILDEEEVAE